MFVFCVREFEVFFFQDLEGFDSTGFLQSSRVGKKCRVKPSRVESKPCDLFHWIFGFCRVLEYYFKILTGFLDLVGFYFRCSCMILMKAIFWFLFSKNIRYFSYIFQLTRKKLYFKYYTRFIFFVSLYFFAWKSSKKSYSSNYHKIIFRILEKNMVQKCSILLFAIIVNSSFSLKNLKKK